MKRSIYVRPDLDATRTGRADPKVVVAGWVKCLKELLKTSERDFTRNQVRTLFVLREKFRRLRPDLLSQVEGAQRVLEEASRRILRQPYRYARMAMEAINLQKWKKEASRLYEMSESLGDPAEEAALGEEVLAGLDEADLVVQGAQKLGCKNSELDTELDKCNGWLSRNADLFLSCGLKVQRMALSFREEMPQAQSSLAKTSWKYVEILDELEIARKEFDCQGQAPLDPVAVNSLLKN